MSGDFAKWEASAEDGTPRYRRQSEIIAAALRDPGHRLDRLLELMRQRGESALYLCGTRLDSDYALGSGDLGVALSVLPEDGPKAAIPGYHPASTEVYIVFQGGLGIEALVDGALRTTPVEQHGVCVIPPGRCHRVPQQGQRQAASLIVKTNPGGKPGVVRCEDCERYPRPADCPLHRRWLADSPA